MTQSIAKPFIKWVGGKSQLLPQLTKIINDIYSENPIQSYIEPFIGGGALFFWLKSYRNINSAVISDVNPDLILTYRVVQQFVHQLINELSHLEKNYLSSDSEEREIIFYNIRTLYNLNKINFDYESSNEKPLVIRAAQFIFLNKTCFNGLYRQNSKGGFNVPFGRYKTPNICDTNNLINCSVALKDSVILCGDFVDSLTYIDSSSLVYLDPPYKPISKTSSFTKYHKSDFDDNDQVRLADFYKKIDLLGSKVILSNSDPSSVDSENQFFEDLYRGFDILRVSVTRTVSAVASSRKSVTELIIKNMSLV